MRKTISQIYLFLALILYSTGIVAQISTDEIPPGITMSLDNSHLFLHTFLFDEKSLDPDVLENEFPQMAGESLPVGLVFSDKASATKLDDGSVLWHLKLHVPDAQYLGIVFSNFSIAEKEKFYIYDESGQHYLGAFTSDNNTDRGIFSSHILPTSTLILEYHTPPQGSAPNFVIDEMIYIWSDYVVQKDDADAGLCNVNVNCDEGFIWQKQKRGVARILLRSGTSWYNCTGTLVNNTLQDQTAYFLTADHCGVSASTEDLAVWQFYFNYEYTSCINSGTASLNRMIEGAELVAKAPIQSGTDFKLLLLNDSPPLSWNPYYNGWSRSLTSPQWGVTIHHPGGDAKKISTFTKSLTSSTFTGGMPLGYWKVEWAPTVSGHGVTEGGSSGSPLFDHDGLIAGTLTGGSASCTAPTNPDYYGKFYLHWDANGATSDKRLIPWLDPVGENPEFLYGLDPNAATNFVVVDISPQNGGLVSGAGYYASNETVRLTAIANDKYWFVHWKNHLDQVVSTSESIEFVMPESDVLLFAVFTNVQSNSSPPESSFRVDIAPNPASDFIALKLHNATGSARVIINNLNGQQVAHYTLTHPTAQINLRGLQSGVYIITIESGNNILRKKIMVR